MTIKNAAPEECILTGAAIFRFGLRLMIFIQCFSEEVKRFGGRAAELKNAMRRQRNSDEHREERPGAYELLFTNASSVWPVSWMRVAISTPT